LAPVVKKAYLSRIRKSNGTQIPGGWSARSDEWTERMRAQNVQNSYVIALATVALRYTDGTVRKLPLKPTATTRCFRTCERKMCALSWRRF